MDPNCKPVHAIARSVDVGVIKEDFSSEWGSPIFEIPKEIGSISIKIVTNFRKLIVLLKRHPFLIAKIGHSEMIRSTKGLFFASQNQTLS
jgi:hypothetical protein